MQCQRSSGLHSTCDSCFPMSCRFFSYSYFSSHLRSPYLSSAMLWEPELRLVFDISSILHVAFCIVGNSGSIDVGCMGLIVAIYGMCVLSDFNLCASVLLAMLFSHIESDEIVLMWMLPVSMVYDA